MKKLLAMLCAAMLCTCCFALAACGGSASSSAAGSASASSAAADASASFIGDWTLAGAETQGVTVAGDFGSMLGMDVGIKLSIADGGTGTASFGEQSESFTWTEAGEGAITITMSATASDESASSASAEASDASATDETAADETTEAMLGAGEPLEFKLADGVLSAETTSDGQTVKMLFTADGKLSGAPEISAANATPITAEADLVGEWKLSGLNMMGLVAYGEADALSSIASGQDTTLVFEEGGKCTMSGQAVEYTVSADGAALTANGQSLPIKKLGDSIILDMAEAMGGTGIDFLMMYSK